MEKIALFAFNGDPMCFIHVLLNALEYDARGYEVAVIIEGSATKLVSALNEKQAQFHGLYTQLVSQGLIAGVCRACALKMNVLDAVEEQALPVLDSMAGHPSMADFTERGYKIITF